MQIVPNHRVPIAGARLGRPVRVSQGPIWVSLFAPITGVPCLQIRGCYHCTSFKFLGVFFEASEITREKKHFPKRDNLRWSGKIVKMKGVEEIQGQYFTWSGHVPAISE